MNILIFGAGSTGRGHLAELLWRHGVRNISFVEKDAGLAELLNRKREYTVRLLGTRERTVTIGPVRALAPTDAAGVADAFCNADLVLTAVLAENLKDVATTLAPAIAERRRRMILRELNIIACENLENASSHLKDYIYVNLDPEVASYADSYLGFPDAMISRVVPLALDTPGLLLAEDYNEWAVRRSAWVGRDFRLPCLELVDNLEARLERKLWIHNGGHATVAYAGWLRGHKYIHEAVSEGEIARFAGAVLDELGDIAAHKHGFTTEDVREYERGLVVRGSIAEMRDEIIRVVRDPIRKLGIRDRLLAPAIYAREHGLENGGILESVANVTLYRNPADVEASEMAQWIDGRGVGNFLAERIGLKGYPDLVEKISRIRERKQP